VRRSWLRLFLAGVVVAGAVAGYIVSTQLGERLLHREIETQLTRLLAGPVEIGEVEVHFEGGLRIEARRVEAYPAADASQPPALRARRVIAGIDLLALLIGRLELSSLILEAPTLRIEQDGRGQFLALPLPRLSLGPTETGASSFGEALVARVESLDQTAETLFESLRAVDRIEIQDGTMLWIRPASGRDAERPREIRLELVSSLFERNWLSDAVGLEWSAVFVDGLHTPFPFEVAVHRSARAAFEWTLSISQMPLETADIPLPLVEEIDALSGQLSTQVRLYGGDDQPRRLRIDGQVRDASLGLRRSGSQMQRDEVELSAEIEISANRLRLLHGHLEGERLGIDLKGALQRPIQPESQARVEARMLGVELEDLYELAHSLELESQTASSLSQLLERVEDGRIRYIEAAGTARLHRWQDLASGRTHELPGGFLLGGAFEEVSLATGLEDQIEGLRGQVEWVEDQITLRNMTAFFRGSQLPQLNLVLDGVSHLTRTPIEARRISARPPPIPGLAALFELIRPKDPDALPPVKAIGLALDELEHPLLRWPFHDLRVLLEPIRRGMEIHVREGRWGGAAVSGEALWLNHPEIPTLTANLVLGPAAATPDLADPMDPSMAAIAAEPIDLADQSDPRVPTGSPDAADPVAPSADPDAPSPAQTPPTTSEPSDDRWGGGRFELEFRPHPKLPFRTAAGFVRLKGSRIVANEVQLEVEPEGQIAARILLELDTPDQVGVDLSFALTDARLEHVGEFIALSPGLAHGLFDATGSLRGSIRPHRPLIAKLDGQIRTEVRSGGIRAEVPLLLRLSQASEGYNLFANEDELTFESMTATIEFDQGSLLAEDFEIEGPLRIYARGRLDVLARPGQVRGVVGIFLFRAPNQILENLPLVRYFLPGSERGLIGAYYEVEGAIAEPSVESLPLETLLTAVPAAIKAPFKVLRFLFDNSSED